MNWHKPLVLGFQTRYWTKSPHVRLWRRVILRKNRLAAKRLRGNKQLPRQADSYPQDTPTAYTTFKTHYRFW